MDAPSNNLWAIRSADIDLRLDWGRPTSWRTVRVCHAGIRVLPRSFAAYMKRDD